MSSVELHKSPDELEVSSSSSDVQHVTFCGFSFLFRTLLVLANTEIKKYKIVYKMIDFFVYVIGIELFGAENRASFSAAKLALVFMHRL